MTDHDLPVRVSPYYSDRRFRLVVGFFRGCGGFFLVLSPIVLVLGFVASSIRDLPEPMFAGIYGMFICLAIGCVTAGMAYVVRLLADIEQHTFRTAQMLEAIATSKRPKSSVDSHRTAVVDATLAKK